MLPCLEYAKCTGKLCQRFGNEPPNIAEPSIVPPDHLSVAILALNSRPALAWSLFTKTSSHHDAVYPTTRTLLTSAEAAPARTRAEDRPPPPRHVLPGPSCADSELSILKAAYLRAWSVLMCVTAWLCNFGLLDLSAILGPSESRESGLGSPFMRAFLATFGKRRIYFAKRLTLLPSKLTPEAHDTLLRAY